MQTDRIQGISHQPRQRHGILSLRKRSADHPMAMFALLVGTVFASIIVIPATGSAFASLGAETAPAITKPADDNRAAAKGDRLPMSETDIACRGQAWGSESAGCLAVIEKESGKGEARKIRVIANAATPGTAPNIF